MQIERLLPYMLGVLCVTCGTNPGEEPTDSGLPWDTTSTLGSDSSDGSSTVLDSDDRSDVSILPHRVLPLYPGEGGTITIVSEPQASCEELQAWMQSPEQGNRVFFETTTTDGFSIVGFPEDEDEVLFTDFIFRREGPGFRIEENSTGTITSRSSGRIEGEIHIIAPGLDWWFSFETRACEYADW